jgi:hypothetical protein
MSLYYRYLPKGSSLESFKTVSNASFAESSYSDIIKSDYPFSSSIDIKYYDENNSTSYHRPHIYSLKNTLNSYVYLSQHYAFKSDLGDKNQQKLNLISIPSIFYGSSIDKGSIELDFYLSGTLLAKLQDSKKNGELIQTYGDSGLNNVAGIVLYNEGFIILTGSWSLKTGFSETYLYNPNTIDEPRWLYWGAGLNQVENLTISSSFNLNFEGINYVNVVTMMAHAEKGELNFSNNPTFIKNSNMSASIPSITNISYNENENLEIKNTKKYAYEDFEGELEKETYISKIGIYDENKNLIAIAKLAKPIRKTENRDLTFKLKLDI